MAYYSLTMRMRSVINTRNTQVEHNIRTESYIERAFLIVLIECEDAQQHNYVHGNTEDAQAATKMLLSRTEKQTQ